jgi:hypothetical protein
MLVLQDIFAALNASSAQSMRYGRILVFGDVPLAVEIDGARVAELQS